MTTTTAPAAPAPVCSWVRDTPCTTTVTAVKRVDGVPIWDTVCDHHGWVLAEMFARRGF